MFSEEFLILTGCGQVIMGLLGILLFVLRKTSFFWVILGFTYVLFGIQTILKYSIDASPLILLILSGGGMILAAIGIVMALTKDEGLPDDDVIDFTTDGPLKR